MRQLSESSITDAVLDRFAACDDPRFKTILTALVRHMHDFVREVGLTEAEWMAGIQFLTATGQTCTDKRQEFILLSDTLGVSMLVDAINNRKPTGALESAVQGPYYWEGAPERPLGSNLAEGVKGEPAFYSGRVLTLDGAPVADALLDVWSGDGEGNYDMQLPGQTEMLARGKLRTDAEGRYRFRSIRPASYPVPTDGPVGMMLNRMGRHPYRPGHIHMIVSAPGFQTVTTQLFVSGDAYLDSDAVFGVKESLIIDFQRHEPGIAPTGEAIAVPFHTVEHDFVLCPVMEPALQD